MNKKDLVAKLESMDWSGMILAIKIIPSFTKLMMILFLQNERSRESERKCHDDTFWLVYFQLNKKGRKPRVNSVTLKL